MFSAKAQSTECTSTKIRLFCPRPNHNSASGKGGLGWYIFQNRNELYTDKVFAGLAVVILIGLLVENLVFDTLERVTVKRWGMQR